MVKTQDAKIVIHNKCELCFLIYLGTPFHLNKIFKSILVT
jgi:hypothetical protein